MCILGIAGSWWTLPKLTTNSSLEQLFPNGSEARQRFADFDEAFGTDESVDVQTALKSYTTWAAHQMFLEDEVGSVEAGKYADLAIWDEDIYAVDTPSLEHLTCRMTVFDGEVVFERPEGQ